MAMKLSDERAIRLLKRAIDELRDATSIHAALRAATVRRQDDYTEYDLLVSLVDEVGAELARRQKVDWDLQKLDATSHYSQRWYVLNVIKNELEQRSDPSLSAEERRALLEVTQASVTEPSDHEKLLRELRELVQEIRSHDAAHGWVTRRLEKLLAKHGGDDGRDQAEEE